MAIEPLVADIIRRIAPSLGNKRTLCLGYPDILLPGAPPADPELQSIAAWHHWKGSIARADAWLAALGLEPEYWDVTVARGPERVVDLNDVAQIDCGLLVLPGCGAGPEFGLVVDPGTLEHVWKAPLVIALLSQICAIGGYIVHANPLGMGNHGFWSLHPTAYADFYAANGFVVETLAELSGPLEARQVRAVPATKRFHMAQDGVMVCVARKEREVPLTWPIQSKYVKNPMLKGTVS